MAFMQFLLSLVVMLPLTFTSPIPQRLVLGGSSGSSSSSGVIGTIGSSGSSRPSIPSSSSQQPRSGRSMVVFKKSLTYSASDILQSITGNGGLILIIETQVFQVGQFKGFSGSLTVTQISSLENDPRVAYIEEDGWATTQQQAWVAQSGARWGLARISHRATGDTTYIFNNVAGAGACVYTIDTGVDVSNPEFEGRATFVKSFIEGAQTDDNGHGTHVAGTIASRTFGVAKNAKLYAIKVLNANGGGYWSDIVSGINYAVADSKTRSCPKGVVLNMSLGGRKSQAVNDAVGAAVDAGIFVAVAAGNDAADIATCSPASEPKVFSVGASDVRDKIASFSNSGRALGIFAPGVDIVSIWKDRSTTSLSGTSMATPYIAGLAAYMLSMYGPTNPGSLGARLRSYSTKDVIDMTGTGKAGTPNMLAYNGSPF